MRTRLMARLALAGLLLVTWLAFGQWAWAGTLLPNGEQTFVDANGAPLANGLVYFYTPNTLTPKTTWLDAAQASPNTNPVVLDLAGRAVIYGSGDYRQIVRDQFGVQQWDKSTSDGTGSNAVWGGTSTGTANAQAVTAATFTGSTPGQLLEWIVGPGLTNTGATTLTVNGGTPVAVLKESPSGPISLTGGELQAGTVAFASWDGTQLQLLTNQNYIIGPLTTLTSATTTNLCSIPSHNVSITGTVTITGLGTTSCNTDFPVYFLTFTASLTLTQNPTSLILPGGTTIVTQAGDTAIAQFLGSGNWRVYAWQAASGIPLRLTTGTPAQGDLLYYNSTSLTPTRLPAGTSGFFLKTLGPGADPAWATPSVGDYQVFTTSGTWTKPASVSSASQSYVQCWGGGGGGSANAGGGGGGGYNANWFVTSSLTATVAVTVGAGGTAGSGTSAGTAAGNSSFGAFLVAYAGGSAAGTGGSGGGGGGGGLTSAGANGISAGAGGAGGGPNGGAAGASSFTGGAGGGNGSGSFALWGGGGGSAGGTSNTNGNSIFGGGGGSSSGGATGGTSVWGGNGGGTINSFVAAPPGGGGSAGAAGARGECRIWTSG